MLAQKRISRIHYSLSSWKWQIATFAIIHILIFSIFFKIGWFYGNFIQDDFGLPLLYSSRIMLGHIPYRDFMVEYPPLSLLFMLLPRLFTYSPSLYAQLFSIEMLVFDLFGLFLVAAISRNLDKPLWKPLAVYTLALLAIGPIITVRFDMAAAVIFLAALYAFTRGKSTVSWILLAVGALTKLFPAVAIPLLLIYHLKNRQYRQIIKGMGVFLLACLVVCLPFLVLSPGGFLDSFTYQTGRSLQIETAYSSFLLLGKAFGLTSLQTDFSSGSTNIISPLANAFAHWSMFITLVFLLLLFWSYYRNISKSGEDGNAIAGLNGSETALLVNYFLLTVMVFVLTNKVFSPQYLIWFFPLIPLIISRWDDLPWLLFIMAGFMTYFVYPKDYGGLEYNEWLAIGMLVLRNVALIVLAVMVVWGRKLVSADPKLDHI